MTVTVAGQTINVPVKVAASRRRAAVQLPPRGDAGPVEGRLQHGGLPRLFAGQERLQAVAPRRRSGAGLRLHHQGVFRPPGQLAGARGQPAGRQAARRCAARRGRPLRARTAWRTTFSSTGSSKARPATWPIRPASSRVRLVPDKLVLQPGPEASAAAHRRLHRRHDCATSRGWASSPPTTTQFAERRRRRAGHRRRRGRDGHRRPLRADVRRHERHRAASRVRASRRRPCRDHLIDQHVVEKLNRLKIDAVAAGRRRGVPAPRLSRPDRRAAQAGRSPGLPGRRRSEQARARRSTRCSTGRSSSITGRSSGATCCRTRATRVSPPSVYLFREFIRSAVAVEHAAGRVRPPAS